jgi:hypothetical protein
VCDLCERAFCEPDDNSCTTDCNPATGTCDYIPLEDGTSCNYAGLSGVCIDAECGQDPCDVVDCNDDDACTHDTCDYVDGSCVHAEIGDGERCTLDWLSGRCASGVCLVDCSNAPDGTPCGDVAGTCQAGSCEGRFACTEQGIRNATWVGGGPHTFDCEGPQTVVTEATIVIGYDVILDGEGKLAVDGGHHGGELTGDEHRVFQIGTPFIDVRAELRGFIVTGGWGLNGGGIDNWKRLTLKNTTVSGNAGLGAGGIMSWGELRLENSTVSGNWSWEGVGGIHSTGPLTMTNSSISDNSGQIGGGIRTAGGTLKVRSSTVSGNWTGGQGSAVYADWGSIDTALTLIDGDCVGATVASNGYNIESPGDTCGFDQPTDQVNVSADDLKLGELADNGGPTMTHALLPDSVAIDQIPVVDCQVTEDQRGEPRPGGTLCDVGAFEVQP